MPNVDNTRMPVHPSGPGYYANADVWQRTKEGDPTPVRQTARSVPSEAEEYLTQRDEGKFPPYGGGSNPNPPLLVCEKTLTPATHRLAKFSLRNDNIKPWPSHGVGFETREIQFLPQKNWEGPNWGQDRSQGGHKKASPQ